MLPIFRDKAVYNNDDNNNYNYYFNNNNNNSSNNSNNTNEEMKRIFFVFLRLCRLPKPPRRTFGLRRIFPEKAERFRRGELEAYLQVRETCPGSGRPNTCFRVFAELGGRRRGRCLHVSKTVG